MMSTYLRALIITLIVLPQLVYGVSDSFNVSLSVGDDTEAPSVPQNLTAIAVAPTQVDLDWDDSTDNFALEGYQVWRDDVQIATTTASLYSDTTVSPDTTYEYYVTAFDYEYNGSRNISASSTPASVTTPALPVDPEDEEEGSDPQSQRFSLETPRWNISTTETSIRITFNTNLYTQSRIRWGETGSYELGYSSVAIYKKNHNILISELSPNTTYWVELILELPGPNSLRQEFRITTDSLPDTTPPANVMNLRATADEEDVTLTWNNPLDVDFDRVRVVRNDNFYPNDIYDGWVVYEGDGERATDTVSAEGTYYYTVFSIDDSDNISSGAVVMATVGDDFFPDVIEDSLLPSVQIDIEDLIFLQNSARSPINENGEVLLRSGENTTVGIIASLLPQHLKTIVVTLRHPHDSSKQFSFLLRINQSKTAYEAVIGSLDTTGLYPLSVSIYDFETKSLGQTDGLVRVILNSQIVVSNATYLIPDMVRYWLLLLFCFFILLMAWLIMRFLTRREDRKL